MAVNARQQIAVKPRLLTAIWITQVTERSERQLHAVSRPAQASAHEHLESERDHERLQHKQQLCKAFKLHGTNRNQPEPI